MQCVNHRRTFDHPSRCMCESYQKKSSRPDFRHFCNHVLNDPFLTASQVHKYYKIELYVLRQAQLIRRK